MRASGMSGETAVRVCRAHPSRPRPIDRSITMKSADSTKAATEAGTPIVETYGEVFPDGSMIELVA